MYLATRGAVFLAAPPLEVGLGYGVCVLLEKLGLATLQRDALVSRAPSEPVVEAQASS